ncbi:hypothetical protein YA0002_02760 [Pseudomonas cichorii]|uniref:hypothetical protein n=1 Tax=Pseudomonas cichorii TaxID=36746 RepID=UPI0018E63EBC|nr:hypothetical protein [Pseudomonas cichorii]MBI6851673.1 hypothetical protein [Pseudomonas cichorii]
MARQFNTRLTLDEMAQRLRATPVAPPVVTWDSDDTDARLIRDWLSALQMLKGVPFNYLVADMAMLPGESLRFFQVDKGWLTALLDGAFSIGSTTVDSDAAQQACIALRAAAEDAVQSCEMRQALHAEAVPEAQCRPVATASKLSGFLLRSNLLDAWPGLEVQGLTDYATLSIVRMELLAPGLLLCLFNDRLTRVRFTLPAEASHFGMRNTTDMDLDKALRTNGRRVIPLARLAAGMGEASQAPLDAASFALKMVESADAVEFSWSMP